VNPLLLLAIAADMVLDGLYRSWPLVAEMLGFYAESVVSECFIDCDTFIRTKKKSDDAILLLTCWLNSFWKAALSFSI
jgi:hypothetical protein